MKTTEERVLEQLVAAARSDAANPAEFDQLESQLRARWAVESREHARSQAGVKWRASIAVAAAAAVLLGGLLTSKWHREHPVAKAPAAPSAVVMDAASQLRTGSVVTANDTPITVVHPGVATWTLAPHGKAAVLDSGRYLTISLYRGRIDAQVVPSQKAESFAIETRRWRVAVHGTTFSVQTTADSGIVVGVTSGSVVVGKPGQPGHTEGKLLGSAAQQLFTDEATAHEEFAPPAQESESAAAAPGDSSKAAGVTPPSERTLAPGASPRRAEAQLPETLSNVEKEAALDATRAATARCFAEQLSGAAAHDSNVVVHVETRVTLTIGADGRVQLLTFDPQVPSAVLDCARRELLTWSTGKSQRGAVASRAIMLTP